MKIVLVSSLLPSGHYSEFVTEGLISQNDVELFVYTDNDEKNKNFRLNKAANIISDISILYPKGGSAKRVDIKVETDIFHLNFNIRNKQGGILPSHIMCDYKIKWL